MTGSKKPDQTPSPDTLAKTSAEASVELSETALAEASGGSLNFTSQPTTTSLKLDGADKWQPTAGLLLPAVQKP